MNQKIIQLFYTLVLMSSYTIYGMEASSSSSRIPHTRPQNVASPLNIVIESQDQNKEIKRPSSPCAQARSQGATNTVAIALASQILNQENTPPRPIAKNPAKESMPPRPYKSTLKQKQRKQTMPSERDMDVAHSYGYDLALYSDKMIGGSQQERNEVFREYYFRFNIIPNKGKSFFQLQEQIERKKNDPSDTLENIVYKALQTDTYESKKTFACQCGLSEDCECIVEEITCNTVTIDQVRELLKTTPSNPPAYGYKKPPMLSIFYSKPY